MDAMNAVKVAARRSGTSLIGIGPAMGKSPSYVSVKTTKGNCPRANTLATMLGACGWSLVAVPSVSVPPEGVVIDS